eukprot:gnl/TRDRNA2_/TRDRNA2_31790_c0_seq1.p1 gnl/TRDRNA2_/TRDRNA2_31790_c0~~gnl/TRDRNA2_/TRDRNA2_31790_c0_seq1.p1  ORF type:complete len:518 (+),score=75.02 gnl/TRDRNA2_/TRDRNA2_31790_c0_seq1:56-1609(+)
MAAPTMTTVCSPPPVHDIGPTAPTDNTSPKDLGATRADLVHVSSMKSDSAAQRASSAPKPQQGRRFSPRAVSPPRPSAPWKSIAVPNRTPSQSAERFAERCRLSISRRATNADLAKRLVDVRSTITHAQVEAEGDDVGRRVSTPGSPLSQQRSLSAGPSSQGKAGVDLVRRLAREAKENARWVDVLRATQPRVLTKTEAEESYRALRSSQVSGGWVCWKEALYPRGSAQGGRAWTAGTGEAEGSAPLENSFDGSSAGLVGGKLNGMRKFASAAPVKATHRAVVVPGLRTTERILHTTSPPSQSQPEDHPSQLPQLHQPAQQHESVPGEPDDGSTAVSLEARTANSSQSDASSTPTRPAVGVSILCDGSAARRVADEINKGEDAESVSGLTSATTTPSPEDTCNNSVGSPYSPSFSSVSASEYLPELYAGESPASQQTGGGSARDPECPQGTDGGYPCCSSPTGVVCCCDDGPSEITTTNAAASLPAALLAAKSRAAAIEEAQKRWAAALQAADSSAC